ncbi:MAG: glycosyltransferase family 2 protein [Candidatus Woesebacteria bacterium]|nr:glycosyltransferase family 2 protein [Candidatus Woesebacteria bacterium]
MKLSIIIPTYNEGKTIEKIIDKVFLQKNIYEVIIVNDGSNDDTQQKLQSITERLLKSKKLKIITHKNNLGKGAAIKTGFENVKGDAIIIQDADLEYNPEEYSILLKKYSGQNVIYGSRILGNNRHAYKRTYLGNITLTWINNILFETNLTDIYTCYKLIPAKIAKKLNIHSHGFEIEAEITAKLLNMGIKITEVPITFNPRHYEEGKKIKAVDALKGICTLLYYKLLSSKKYKTS